MSEAISEAIENETGCQTPNNKSQSNKMHASVSAENLRAKGYSIRAAAKAVCRSAPHVSMVLKGTRRSATTMDALSKLPNLKINKQNQAKPSKPR